MDLKSKIEKVLSEILSDKYECDISIRFGAGNERQETDTRAKENIA
jgi:hypothetical protein